MVIECVDVSYRYQGSGPWAIDSVTLEVRPGERMVITGPAGSGKTTLLQLMDALVLPVRGDVLFDGRSVRDLAARRELHAVRRRAGVLFQFPEDQFFHQSAYEELTFSLRNFFGSDEKEIHQRAASAASYLGLDTGRLKEVSPFSLSTGQKRRLALASALVMEPEILMLDEPTAGLDPAGRKDVARVISSLGETAVVVVTHNLEDFLGVAERVVCMDAGRVVFDASVEDLLARPDIARGYPFEIPLVVKAQQWLRAGGLELDGPSWDMDGLVRRLRLLAGMPENGE